MTSLASGPALHVICSASSPPSSQTPTVAYEMSPHAVDFMDLHIHKGRRFLDRQVLDLSVHRKRLNRCLYLPWTSAHPKHQKLAFLTGELFRFVRNISSFEYFLRDLRHFARALRVRGYPAAFIRAAFTTVRYSDRAQYLRPRKPLAPDPTRSPFAFVCPHSPPQETTSIPSYVGAGRVWSRGFVHPGHHPGVPTGVDPSHHASAKAPPKTAQVLAGRLLRQVTWPLLSFRSHRMCAWVFFPNRWVSSTVWGHRVACWCQ